jgi:hypothetical protein
MLPGETRSSATRFVQRWGSDRRLFVKGQLPVPSLFFESYACLNPPLNSGEALFVLQLMNFKWGRNAPFPSYRSIAKRMGISVKMARTHAQNLESKGYLWREIVSGRTNRFNLDPLFNALVERRGRLR